MAGKSPNYKDIPLAPVTEGIILDTTLSHYVAPEGSVSWAENLHNDSLGVMTARRPLGSARTVANAITTDANRTYNSWIGLLYGSVTTAWKHNATAYVTTDIMSTAPSAVSGAGSDVSSFGNFDYIQGYLCWLNGAGNLALYQTGGVVSTTRNVGMAGTGVDVLSIGFAGRVWGADTDDSSCKVYYSDVIPSGGIASVTGTGQYLSLNVNESDAPTALWRSQNCLFAFTQSAIYRIYSTQSVDNSPCAGVGAISHKAITSGKDGVYFASQNGIFRLSEDGNATDVSQKVRSIIHNIYPENNVGIRNIQASVSAWSDADSVYFSYGYNSSSNPKMPVTMGEDLNKSYILKYHIPTQNWSVYSVAGAQILGAPQGNLPTNGVPPLGLYEKQYPTTPLIIHDEALGKYYLSKFNNYYLLYPNLGVTYGGFPAGATNDFDRATSPMYIKYVTKWQTFGSEAHLKRISGLSVASTNAAGLNFGYIVDTDTLQIVRPIGSLEDDYVTLFRDFQTVEFNRIKFVITGTAKAPLTIGQITVLGLDDLGYSKN